MSSSYRNNHHKWIYFFYKKKTPMTTFLWWRYETFLEGVVSKAVTFVLFMRVGGSWWGNCIAAKENEQQLADISQIKFKNLSYNSTPFVFYSFLIMPKTGLKQMGAQRKAWSLFMKQLCSRHHSIARCTEILVGLLEGCWILLTLGDILGTKHLELQCNPSQCDSSWQQQITLYVIIITVPIPLLHLSS